MAAVTIYSEFGTQGKKKFVIVFIVSPSIFLEVT